MVREGFENLWWCLWKGKDCCGVGKAINLGTVGKIMETTKIFVVLTHTANVVCQVMGKILILKY